MKKIGLLSDTHGIVPKQVYTFFADCDFILHAGDLGNAEVLHELESFKPTYAVYGNIDGFDVIPKTSKTLILNCEEMKIVMMHIGGYPGKYTPEAWECIRKEHPNIFISGHSHILKVMFDRKNNLLHINPGAAGKYGFHLVSTLVRFNINGTKAENLEIMEFKKQG